MIQVRCESCQATFDLDERRLPRSGMRVRCPRCASSFHVSPPGAEIGTGPTPVAGVKTIAFGAADIAKLPPAPPSGAPLPTSAAPPAPPVNKGTMQLGAAAVDALAALDDIETLDAQPSPSLLPPTPPTETSADLSFALPSEQAPPLAGGPGIPGTAGTRPLGTPEMPLRMGAGPAPAMGAGITDLPTPVAQTSGLLDLPVAAPARPAGGGPLGGGLPAPTDFSIVDLPSTPGGTGARPAGARPPPVPDLPTPAQRIAALPISASGAALPAAARGGVGLPAVGAGAGLPIPAGVAGLPMAGGAGLPSAIGSGLPTAAGGGLPTVGGARGPAAPAMDSLEFGGLDIPLGETTTPTSPDGSSLRLPEKSIAGKVGSPPTEFSGEFSLPLPSDGDEVSRLSSPGLDLTANVPREASVITRNDEEFDRSQSDGGAPRAPAPSLQGFDPFRSGAGTGVVLHKLDAAPAEIKPQKERNYLALGLTAFTVLALAGASLQLTPAGAFGYKSIDKLINGPKREAEARRAIDQSIAWLEQDNYGKMKRALRDLEEQKSRTPEEQALTAFDTLAHYYALSRYGNDSQIAGRARVLYDQLGALDPRTPHLNIARAARDLFNGHAERLRNMQANDNLSRDIRTMALLDGGDPAEALDAARASARRPTPRSRFLLARALYLTDDREGAARECEALLRDSAEHMGAHVLLARLLSERPEGRDRAVQLATQVVTASQNASQDERTEAAVLVGQIELARARVEQARNAFSTALELDPRSPQALVGSASILLREGNFTDALARYQAAKSADPEDLDAKIGIAMSSLGLNRANDAREELEPAVRAHAGDARVHFWLGKALFSMNELAGAEREFREAVRLDNTNLESYTTLASLLYTMQRAEAADQVLDDARAHVSDQSLIHRALGEGRFALRQYEGARHELEAAVAEKPNDGRAHFFLARTLRKLKLFDEATRELETLERLDPAYPGLVIERGLVSEERGDAASALPRFRQALARDPQNSDLMVRVGSCLVRTGQFAEADAHLAAFVTEHPTNAEAHFVLGRAKLGQAQLLDAVRLLERAAELDPTRADFRAYAAQANLERAQFARALEHARLAIDTDPTYARSYWVKAEVEMRLGQHREAIVDANRAYTLDRSVYEALATWALADDALGRPDQAMTLLRAAINVDPRRGEWHFQLARLLQDHGHAAEANSEYQRALAVAEPSQPPPGWVPQAHRMLAESADAAGDRSRALEHYQSFLRLAARTAPGYDRAARRILDLQH